MAEICPSWKVHVACASVLSYIATRVGLPGTIVGLIETFTAVTDGTLPGRLTCSPQYRGGYEEQRLWRMPRM